jgi:hypothetical protein
MPDDVLFSTETEEPETEEVTEEDEYPEQVEVTPMVGADTNLISEANPEDPLYVPVTNVNYIPEGSPEYLEGFVPNTPGDDPTLLRIKAGLETQGHLSGPVGDPPVE